MLTSLAHPAVRVGSGATGAISAGVSVADVTNAATGGVIATLALVTLAISVARNNRKNRDRTSRERRKVFRAGYMRRDRELAQTVSNATYWQSYAMEHRKPSAPPPNPPVIVPTPLPADDDAEFEDEDGDGDL
ncbi:MAG TPA: hypothetical protein VHZ96_26490 [Frankiaceae bacterium]|jgi:hypothetical protein|nr:hypothetical protein [Frankiaceae bacterium]